MKIVRHLLSFTWLFITLAFLLGLIYFRADLFPDSINKPVDTAMAAIEEATGLKIPQYVAASKASQGEESTSAVIKADAEVTESVYPEFAEDVSVPAPVEDETTQSVVPAVSEESSDDKADDMAAVVEIVKDTISEKVDEMIETVEQGSDQAIESVVSMATPEPESELVPVVEQVPASADAADANVPEIKQESKVAEGEVVVDTKQLLHTARSLYWKGDMQAAEKAYMDLAEQESLDPNVFGELGNVYYAQGKWKQAGDAYYEAAVLLLDLNQTSQVNYLLRVIQGLDAEAAEKLKHKISG